MHLISAHPLSCAVDWQKGNSNRENKMKILGSQVRVKSVRTELGMMVQACDPSTEETEAGGLWE